MLINSTWVVPLGPVIWFCEYAAGAAITTVANAKVLKYLLRGIIETSPRELHLPRGILQNDDGAVENRCQRGRAADAAAGSRENAHKSLRQMRSQPAFGIKRISEKFYAGTTRLRMRPVAAMSSSVSDVCARYS